MKKAMFVLFVLLQLFLIIYFIACSSEDVEKVDCKKLCDQLSKCENDTDTNSCNTFCKNMTDKKYFDDPYIKKLIECTKKESCEEFNKCGDELDDLNCSNPDPSAFVKVYCEKRANECKTYENGYDSCAKEETEQIKKECFSTKFYNDLAECVKKLNCSEFNTDKCWEELVGVSD